ncbi:zinc ribbon domain-containing protein [Actinacidiphila paucisporea]|uniref:Zinc-ribbon domain-containing protein n=1 Tax=Actinacidiphila paucisporea TaxID=310782 RepID=A0A1M7PVC2_9ACTN|nr:zinc ribbon domain-containing protein [Actinacidiphila paucisporea]SHN21458.1 zinc-ribbon domain-containing protein [Actinacidiphila paucisporea]
MSFCPACGNPVSDTSARFCPKCGRELPGPPPSAPPAPVHAAPPAPPAYMPTATYPGAGPAYPPPPPPPAPGTPSPAAQFAHRVFTGRWDGAVLAAVVPALVLLVVAGGLGAWSQHALRGSAVGWFKRSRIALALIVQGLGGHLSTHQKGLDLGGSDSLCAGSSEDSSGDYGSGDSGDFAGSDGSSDFGPMCDSASMSGSAAIVPLTFTVLWLLTLVLVLRSMRGRYAGPEAAVRVALLSSAAATVLSFVAQGSLEGVAIHTGPFRVMLWSFLLSLVTALVVLDGPALRRRSGAAWRVVGTAGIALLATVLFASAVVLVVALGNVDNGVTGDDLVILGAVLPNLGLSALALGWGAPFRIRTGAGGSDHFDRHFGLSQLSHFWNGWATVLALLGGALCALVVGLLATGRTRGRGEQFAVAGVLTAMLAALVVIGGAKSGGSNTLTGAGDGLVSAQTSLGSVVPETLFFALLWSLGGVLAAPYVRRALGMAPPPAGQAGSSPYAPPPFPYAPPQPQPQPQPQAPPTPQPPHTQQAPQPSEVHDLGIVQPPRLSGDDSTRRDEGGGRHR